MAGWYVAAFERAQTEGLNLESATVTAHLVSAGYTVDLATHSVLADVPSGAREASAVMSGANVTGGVFDADDVTFTAASGDPAKAVVIETDGDLLWYHDNFGAGPGATTLPLNGSNVTVQWAPGGIATLTNA